MSVGHLDVSFVNASIHVFCPFLHWILCFIVLGVVFGSLIHFELAVLYKAQGTGRVSSLAFGWLITPSTIC